MKGYLKIPSVVIVSLLAGAYLHKWLSAPGNIPSSGDCATDTLIVYDTIPYHAPRPQTELATGTRRYTVPTHYIIGGGRRAAGAAATVTGAGYFPFAEAWDPDKKGEGRRAAGGDSAIIELPVIQRHYADSTYEAWISGPIDPRLDSLRVFAPTTIITKRECKPPKRWHIGPTVGYGYTPQGFQPYVGISITYSIVSF